MSIVLYAYIPRRHFDRIHASASILPSNVAHFCVYLQALRRFDVHNTLVDRAIQSLKRTVPLTGRYHPDTEGPVRIVSQ